VGKVSELVSRGVRVVVGEPEPEAAEIPAEFFETESSRLAGGRSELPIDLPELSAVYHEANVPAPFRGYGIDKLVEILDSKRLAVLPREVRVAAVLASLDAAGVELSQVIRDAVLRDRALDAFVAAKEREVEALRRRNEARVAELKEDVTSFVEQRQMEMGGLRQSAEGASSAFAQLQLRKRQEEERLHEILAHFLPDNENPIPGGTRKPAKNA
jgi:hypothetical protein